MNPRIRPGLAGPLAGLAVLFALGATPALAQQTGTITGEVIESTTGRPVVGAQIFVPGTGLGAVTNPSGRYLILNVPAGQVTVRVQMIGYAADDQTVSVTAGQTATANFEMRQSVIALDQVVVTGAGAATEKRKLGNTIATIDAGSLENKPVTSFSEMISGREPGVVGLPSGGLTGEGARIRIRGNASLSMSNEPIVYVDGVRVDNAGGFGGVSAGGGGSPSRLDDINPEAIERVEILKGAAAATLYGSEASAGVIQIFTKRGGTGDPRWTFSMEQGAAQYPEDRIKPNAGFARTPAQADRVNKLYGLSVAPFEVFEVPLVNDFLGTGHLQNYSLSVSGGTSAVTYFLSGRMAWDNGPIATEDIGPTSDRDNKKQASANINIFPTEKLRLRFSSLYAETFHTVPQNNNNIFAPITLVQFGKPETGYCNDDSYYHGDGRCTDAQGRWAPGNPTGQVAFASFREALQFQTEQEVQHWNGSINTNYQLMPSLSVDATFGVDVVNQLDSDYLPFNYNLDGFSTYELAGYKTTSDRNNREVSLDAKALWNTRFGQDFSSDFVVGGQGYLTTSQFNILYGTQFPGPGLRVAGATAVQEVSEVYSRVANLGLFAQEQMGWKDFVFVTGGVRYDKNSAFGENTEGALYPKASVSIVPSDMDGWNSDLISSLRLRTAVGRSGLQPGAFDKLTTYGAISSDLGGGVKPDNLGNPDLKPEVSTEWEVGAEIGLLQNRLGLDVTYWDRTLTDALIPRQFPVTGGFPNFQLDNVGEVVAHGVEIGAKAVVMESRDFSLNVFANASYLYQEVTDMGGAPKLKVGGSYPRYRNFVVEGYAPGSLFGAALPAVGPGRVPYDMNGDGQPDTEQEFLAYLQNPISPSALNPMMNDPDGDGPLTVLDNYLGKPLPDWQGSFGFNASFLGNFDFSTLFEYKFGNYTITNLTDGFRQSHPAIGRNFRKTAEVEATLLNPSSTPEQRLAAAKTWAYEMKALSPYDGLNQNQSGDFLRFREVALTYNVPGAAIQGLGVPVRDVSLTLTGRNVALWTKYDGVDPEINYVGRCNGGLNCNFGESIDAFGFPLPRRYTFAVRVGF